MDALAEVLSFASCTELNTGRPKCFCPPFFGVTPPTNCVPYFKACSEWKVPCVPVKPWHITFVVLFTKIDIYLIASTIFFAASLRSEAERIFKLELSKIFFPSL